MDKEISFGDFQQSQPQFGVAPDRNPHFAVACVGAASSASPIFVDLDVMRELESHALDNINVELGGVLLGDQLVDAEGNPFVVVRDSLRAEHYQATRGSFKFTHETWEAITRQRDQFPEKFAIVGWYHTHPGWGVFLSDMDMFICNHFFNRPLDVALVIDPVRDDRGWFTWSQESRPATKQQALGFSLFGHRHREEELQAVAQRYNESVTMSADPRIRLTKPVPAAATVTLLERPPAPTIWIAVAALILGQMALITAMLWRWPVDTAATGSPAVGQSQLDLIVRERQVQAKSEAFREALIAAVEKTPETTGIVDRFAELSEQNLALHGNLDGQAALTRELTQQLNQATELLAKATLDQKNLSNDLARRDAHILSLQSRIDASSEAFTAASGISTWVLLLGGILIGILAAVGGVVGGFALARRREDLETSVSGEEFADRDATQDDSKIKLA